jgi:hypothetical protein
MVEVRYSIPPILSESDESEEENADVVVSEEIEPQSFK